MCETHKYNIFLQQDFSFFFLGESFPFLWIFFQDFLFCWDFFFLFFSGNQFYKFDLNRRFFLFIGFLFCQETFRRS